MSCVQNRPTKSPRIYTDKVCSTFRLENIQCAKNEAPWWNTPNILDVRGQTHTDMLLLHPPPHPTFLCIWIQGGRDQIMPTTYIERVSETFYNISKQKNRGEWIPELGWGIKQRLAGARPEGHLMGHPKSKASQTATQAQITQVKTNNVVGNLKKR